MSAPDTDTDTQVSRHRPALTGILAVLVFAALAAVVMLVVINIPADEQATPVPETAPGVAPQGTSE